MRERQFPVREPSPDCFGKLALVEPYALATRANINRNALKLLWTKRPVAHRTYASGRLRFPAQAPTSIFHAYPPATGSTGSGANTGSMRLTDALSRLKQKHPEITLRYGFVA